MHVAEQTLLLELRSEQVNFEEAYVMHWTLQIEVTGTQKVPMQRAVCTQQCSY
jgi:hypothetical protein